MARKEDVSVSFHHLTYMEDPKDRENARAFTKEEFEEFVAKIESQVPPDLDNNLVFEKVRNGTIIPFSDYHREDDRCVFGRFKAPYTGHSFDNSDHGKVEAKSINQRLFNYMFYYTNDGRIFVGAQYLGNYGGWSHLVNGLKGMFDQKNKIKTTSIRNQVETFQHLHAREIKIRVSKKAEQIDKNNILANEQVITLQRGEGGEQFEQAVRDKIFSIMKKPLAERGDAMKKSLQAAGLQEFDDFEIEDCVVVVDVQNGTKRYHIFENGIRASRYHLSVPLNGDGHPEMLPTRVAMKEAFKNYVLKDIADEHA